MVSLSESSNDTGQIKMILIHHNTEIVLHKIFTGLKLNETELLLLKELQLKILINLTSISNCVKQMKEETKQ